MELGWGIRRGGLGGHDGGGAGHHVVWGGASLPAGNWSVRKKKGPGTRTTKHGLTWIDGPSTLAHSLPERLLQQIPHHGVKAAKKGRV
jgi:hypothetical protein